MKSSRTNTTSTNHRKQTRSFGFGFFVGMTGRPGIWRVPHRLASSGLLARSAPACKFRMHNVPLFGRFFGSLHGMRARKWKKLKNKANNEMRRKSDFAESCRKCLKSVDADASQRFFKASRPVKTEKNCAETGETPFESVQIFQKARKSGILYTLRKLWKSACRCIIVNGSSWIFAVNELFLFAPFHLADFMLQ